MDNILLVDKKEDSKSIEEFLKINNYNIEFIEDFKTAYDIFLKSNFSLILTELDIDNNRAYDFIKKIRINNKFIPIIIISSIKNQDSIIYALEIGADDYITKPYSEFELMSRIRAHLRKINVFKEILKNSSINILKNDSINIGNSQIIFDKMVVKNNNREIYLKYKELNLIKLLYENRNSIVTRDTILKKVWGYNKYITDRVIDTTIASIRKKINDNGKNPKYIKTIKGIGYKLELFN